MKTYADRAISDKKRISKGSVESTVIGYIMDLLNNPPLIDNIVDSCYELQTRQNVTLPVLEKQLKWTEKARMAKYA